MTAFHYNNNSDDDNGECGFIGENYYRLNCKQNLMTYVTVYVCTVLQLLCYYVCTMTTSVNVQFVTSEVEYWLELLKYWLNIIRSHMLLFI